MTREIYAIPVLLGCTLYVVLLHLIPDNWLISAVVSFSLIFGLRAAAIRWDLSVPDWLATGHKGRT